MSTQFFFITGEPSGDVLGASLIKGLKASGGDFEFTGIGGDYMDEQGLQSLLPMDELCVMGIWEIISHIPRLHRLIMGIVEEIETQQPDIVVTIDLPDFNFRVGRLLKKRGVFKGKIIHYGAPTVWAWRPGRAQKVAEFLDGMMCLFPFEPQYFEEHGLRSSFVGHPLAEINPSEVNEERLLKLFNLPDDVLKIGLFFGSRPSEVNTLGALFIEAAHILYEQDQNFVFLVQTLPSLELEVNNLVQDLPVKAFVFTEYERKYEVFKSCDLALAASGTVGLELGYMGVPHLIAYKMHPLSWLVVKFLVKTQYAHLVNIILDKPLVPELLQTKCTPFQIARDMFEMIKRPEKRAEQVQGLLAVKEQLNPKTGQKPSEAAAQFILDYLK